MASRRKNGGKAITKAESTEMTFSDDVPEYVNQDSHRGSEAVGMEDLTIPRIDVVQDLSPQRKANKPEHIEGAETGMLFNTATNRLYGDNVVIVPVLFRKEYVIWRHRDAGGGFRGAFPSESAAHAEMSNKGYAGKTVETKDGEAAMYEVVDTAQHFVLVITGSGDMEEAVLSMSKSKMKASRQLNTLVRTVGGDRWARAYRLETYEAEGAKGEYQNYMFKQLGYVPKHVYERAEEMYESVKSGQKDVDRSSPETEATPEEERY